MSNQSAILVFLTSSIVFTLCIFAILRTQRNLGRLRLSVMLAVTAVCYFIIATLLWFAIHDWLSYGRDLIPAILLLIWEFVVLAVLYYRSPLTKLTAIGVIVAWTIFMYTRFYMTSGVCSDADCLAINVKHDWRSALYFSVITFTTTGYGDYHPREPDRLIAASEALVGYIFFGLFVSLLASYFSRSESREDRGEGHFSG